jgi:outer membrane immunogenic protein
MSKGFLVANLALATMAQAHAADFRKAPRLRDPGPIVSAPKWAGWYVGINAGGAWGTKTFNYNDPGTIPFLWSAAVPVNGMFLGGQIGYNFQNGPWVYGIEADGDWANIKGQNICNTTVFFVNCTANIHALGTVTGRAGIAVDNALLYIKGGLAMARDEFTISNVALPPLATAFSSTVSDTRMGWTFGAGLEYMLFSAWSAKLEYNYMDFGTKRYDFPIAAAAIPANTFRGWEDTQRVHLVKVGLNYHFGNLF